MADHLMVLKTNDLLPDDRLVQTKSQRTAARHDLELLDAEIALVESTIEQQGDSDALLSKLSNSQHQRKKLRAFIAACDVALSPQKRLPAELLSLIFSLSTTSFPTDLPPSGRSSGALAFSHVCARWRMVALNTPELWSDIVLRFAEGLDPYLAMDLAEEWYARSGTKSLSLTLYQWTHGNFRKDHDDVMNDIIQRLVVPYAPRYKSLNLCLSQLCLRTFLGLTQLPLISLESLCLSPDTYVPPFSPWNSNVYVNFTNTPKLVDLQLHDFSRNLCLYDPQMPWNTLTRLSFFRSTLSISQSHEVIRRCRNLVSCLLTLADMLLEDNNNRTRPSSIHLSSLSVLEIQASQNSSDDIASLVEPLINQFLEPLFAPNLTELTLGTSRKTVTWAQSSLVDFITRSCCPLEFFQSSTTPLSSHIIAEIGMNCPSIKTFKVGFHRALQPALLQGMARGDCLPNLTCLVCLVDDLESVIRMLENRWRSIQHDPTDSAMYPAFFTYLMVDYRGSVITAQQAKRIDFFRGQGVEIEITRIVPG